MSVNFGTDVFDEQIETSPCFRHSLLGVVVSKNEEHKRKLKSAYAKAEHACVLNIEAHKKMSSQARRFMDQHKNSAADKGVKSTKTRLTKIVNETKGICEQTRQHVVDIENRITQIHDLGDDTQRCLDLVEKVVISGQRAQELQAKMSMTEDQFAILIDA